MFGGGQEKGMRPGTEPLPNIAAFAKACEIRMAHFDEDFHHVQSLADYLHQQVAALLPDAAFNGVGDIPHVVNLSLPGCKSEVMLRVLEGDEVYVSSGSAAPRASRAAFESARPAQSAHGQRTACVLLPIQYHGRCGRFYCSRAKRPEDVGSITLL